MAAKLNVAPKPPHTRTTRSDANGLEFVGVRLRPDRDKAILNTDRTRANELGRAVADKSEELREALVAWIAIQGAR